MSAVQICLKSMMNNKILVPVQQLVSDVDLIQLRKRLLQARRCYPIWAMLFILSLEFEAKKWALFAKFHIIKWYLEEINAS